MDEIKVFENKEFGELNIIIKDNKEYVEAIQVANILGYANPRDAVLRFCKKGGVVFSDVGVVTNKKLDGTVGIQYVQKKFIDEGNLYRLIIKSKLPNADRFEKWVMDDVLPTIRKHGVYMTDEVISKKLDNPDFIIEIATKLKEEREEKLKAQRQVENLESTITVDKPYTNLGKSIAASSDAITIGDFAKILNNKNIKIGRNRLFSFLREEGYLIKSGKEKNKPKQVYVEQGLFKVTESIVYKLDTEIISTTTLITGKGQMYLLNLMNNLL